MNKLERLKIIQGPTRIEKLNWLSEKYDKNIYIKRDDETGIEISGNKVRKLEYAVKEAIDMGATHLITCGGIQSNHARATTVVGNKLGLKTILVLRESLDAELEGNYFFNKLLGAEIRFVSEEEFQNVNEIMKDIEYELEKEGKKGYSIPVGASNCIGSFGYYNAYEEIIEQEDELGINFDGIVATVGSGGTYAGLYYGNKVNDKDKKIIGINVSDTAEHFKDVVMELLEEVSVKNEKTIDINKEEIEIIDGYVGLGYALSQQEEIDFIGEFASNEGIILDPAYTGKAMYGFVNELEKGTFEDIENILFIHTGGIFGWTKETMNMIK